VKEIPSGCTSARCVKILGGGFGGPHGVAVDGRENVYVADNDGNSVREIPPGCNSPACVRTLGGGFSHPQGVAVDGNGNVFVTDTGNNAVKEIPSGCVFSSCVKTLGSGFSAPWGIAVDRKGSAFIVDAGNHRVVELEVAGPNGTPDAMTSRPPPDARYGSSQLDTPAGLQALETETTECTEGEKTVPVQSQRVFVVSPLRECWTPWLVLEGSFSIHESANILLQFAYGDGTIGNEFEDGPRMTFNQSKPIRKVRFKSLRKEAVTITLVGH
jgi:hypothetical protein